jgi:hypothetical protein
VDKTEHGTWPYKVPGSGIRFAGEPIVADLDNDGQAEVIFTSWPENGGNRLGQLHILDYLGNELHRLDLPAPLGDDWNGGLGAPTIANIDADPDKELVVGTVASGVVAYDLPNTANARILWGTGRGSYQRTGVSAADEGFNLIPKPPAQAINPGQVATYQLTVQTGNNFKGTITLIATSPSPSLTLSLAPTTFTASGQANLTLTDTHPPGPLLPGIQHTIPLTATGGGLTQTTSVSLLVGGTRTYLPVVLK